MREKSARPLAEAGQRNNINRNSPGMVLTLPQPLRRRLSRMAIFQASI
jgi:hypothetical protein